MDKRRFERIKAACERNGISLLQSDEVQHYLDHNGAEASTFNENTILLRKNPTASAVFEELIHATQYKNNEFDGTEISVILGEIRVKEKLIKFKDAYGITDEEDALTRRQLKEHTDELKRL